MAMLSMNPLLNVLKGTLTAQVRADTPDLSTRQLAVFLTVYLDSPEGGHTVRGLAEHLGVSKPAITRAFDRLCEVDFMIRAGDPKDRRSVLAKKTPAGTAFLRTMSGFLGAAQKDSEKLAKAA